MKHTDLEIGQKVLVESKIKNWKGKIISKVEGSRTLFLIQDIERGKGWDEKTQSYKGYFTEGGNNANQRWNRGENYDYGKIVKVHIKKLKTISEYEYTRK